MPKSLTSSSNKALKSGSKKWIQNSINPEKQGALHRMLKVPASKKIPLGVLEKASKSKSPLERKRANWAINVKGKR